MAVMAAADTVVAAAPVVTDPASFRTIVRFTPGLRPRCPAQPVGFAAGRMRQARWKNTDSSTLDARPQLRPESAVVSA